ncbi:hypothetical protein [Providencia manganoxydans]
MKKGYCNYTQRRQGAAILPPLLIFSDKFQMQKSHLLGGFFFP